MDLSGRNTALIILHLERWCASSLALLELVVREEDSELCFSLLSSRIFYHLLSSCASSSVVFNLLVL